MTRIWPNFKGRFLVPSITDANCHGNICQGNICPGDICPYQQYLSCYWSDFDQTFWTHNFRGPKCSWTKLLQTQIFFWSKIFLDTKFFSTPKFFRTQKFFNPKLFQTQFFPDTKFFQTFLRLNIFWNFWDFHWRRGVKPFQAEHFRLKSCFAIIVSCCQAWNFDIPTDFNQPSNSDRSFESWIRDMMKILL